jgi:hypothetical protein
MIRRKPFRKVNPYGLTPPPDGTLFLVASQHDTFFAVASDGTVKPLVDATTIDFSGVATSDPAIAGRVWSNGGVLMVSAG